MNDTSYGPWIIERPANKLKDIIFQFDSFINDKILGSFILNNRELSIDEVFYDTPEVSRIVGFINKKAVKIKETYLPESFPANYHLMDNCINIDVSHCKNKHQLIGNFMHECFHALVNKSFVNNLYKNRDSFASFTQVVYDNELYAYNFMEMFMKKVYNKDISCILNGDMDKFKGTTFSPEFRSWIEDVYYHQAWDIYSLKEKLFISVLGKN